ncbi:MAG: cytidyltransferase [Pseudonocardiales bacterium]|nr:cytidyltransferase [Pseudonocardiales bacterium]
MTARIGYASGVFDMFHIGHLNILKRARAQCDFLVAGVVSDQVVRDAKGKEPMISLAERMQIVRGVKYVDSVIVDNATSKLDVWERVHFEVIFKGDDWRGTDKGLDLETELATVGARVVYFPYTTDTSSTTRRREIIARGDLLQERLASAPYALLDRSIFAA